MIIIDGSALVNALPPRKSEKVVEHHYEKRVIIIRGPCAHSATTPRLTSVRTRPAIEEADTRIFLIIKYAVRVGFKLAMTQANDTDVLVIAVATFSQ